MARPKNDKLREFILRQIPEHPSDIAPFAAKSLGITRALVNGYLRRLLAEGLIEAAGKTKARQYKLKTLDSVSEKVKFQGEVQEDVVWREKFYPHFQGLPENVVQICEYGFLEMLNNAIEHSGGGGAYIQYARNYAQIAMSIADDGIGIFDKIMNECNLSDKHEAILELSKGKLTTDPSHHTGEGIFFTSRMFDRYSIASGGLGYHRQRIDDRDWLVDVEMAPETKGTIVQMEIATSALQTSKEIFDRYLDDTDKFSKTIIPLKLAKYEGEHLVSRSQARRIMTRVERFSEVWLDFSGITEIGQPFADEIFRVWAGKHPKVALRPFNYSIDVERMIRHARTNATERGAPEQPSSASEREAKP
jgi:anti-sigma regulatory factor (Ser/Thr protein kinase)